MEVSDQQFNKRMDRCKTIRNRVAELEAEITLLTKEHNDLLGTGVVTADDVAWATTGNGVCDLCDFHAKTLNPIHAKRSVAIHKKKAHPGWQSQRDLRTAARIRKGA